MSLTVSERQHWKERIGARIEKRISHIKMASKPVFDSLKAKAREQAIGGLGVGDLESERARLKQQIDRLEKQQKLATRKVVALVRGVDVSDVADHYYGGFDTEIAGAIRKREDFEFEQLLASTDEGKKVLALKDEKERLLDTVWLATSPTQVKELWQRLSDILGDEDSQLQKEALKIQPV